MSMNILLVEEDDELHDAIVDFLEERSWGVTACRSYVDAASVLACIPDRSRAPDAIVSDADGLALYMKARARFPGIRWIVTADRCHFGERAAARTAAGAGDERMPPRLAGQFEATHR
jgi:DNA-binding NtrC family response regulator